MIRKVPSIEHINAADLLLDDILALRGSMRDERTAPEVRDVKRLLRGHRPRTDVGKEMFRHVAGGV